MRQSEVEPVNTSFIPAGVSKNQWEIPGIKGDWTKWGKSGLVNLHFLATSDVIWAQLEIRPHTQH